jgi:hypothetical protein
MKYMEEDNSVLPLSKLPRGTEGLKTEHGVSENGAGMGISHCDFCCVCVSPS